MKSVDVRRAFLEYFKKHNHEVVQSSSLIPAQDPTLLFTNAGMNQFKDLFLGNEKRSYTRATSSQKCVRAGGKHNDLENVGYTSRHLTYFEMLGNFSFGDYFKREAISFAWNFLIKEVGLPKEKLYISVFRDDDEAYNIWHDEIGIPKERLTRCGEKDNFWQMGDTGPCGPCSEIHLYKGDEESPHWAEHSDGELFFEVWNLVFMQFNRDEAGNLTPLQQTGVDTGMGLERLCMVLQNTDDVFKTDLFDPIRHKLNEISGVDYYHTTRVNQVAMNVVCDHIRSSSSIIADGGAPSNDGRGYVLRKIIRRAILFAQKLGDAQTVMREAATAFINDFSAVYPELATSKQLILSILSQEVDRFIHNLANGQQIFNKYKDALIAENKTTLSGAQAFKLYDTYGFPLELTKVLATDHNLAIDEDGFAQHMAQQKKQSKQQKTSSDDAAITFPEDIVSIFTGYHEVTQKSIISWVHDADDYYWIITKETPFYAESGGQVNDSGTVTINEHSYTVVDIKKTQSIHGLSIAVKIVPVEDKGSCNVGDIALCSVDEELRLSTMRNHTATHMMHAALHDLVGSHAKQAGSVVNPGYLRFDFSHHEALSSELITQIEQQVNERIWANISVRTAETTLAQAQEDGVIAFFGEKYNPESVRVVTIPGYSAELCGGTHVSATGDIGCFKIVSETSLATGTRRIIAVTGQAALELFQASFTDIKHLSTEFKSKPEQVGQAIMKLKDDHDAAIKEIKKLKKEIALNQSRNITDSIKHANNHGYAAILLEGVDGNMLRELGSQLQDKVPGAYVLLSVDGKKTAFFATVHTTSQSVINHAELQELLQSHGLRGGGKPGQIQGGGAMVTKQVADNIESWIAQKLS